MCCLHIATELLLRGKDRQEEKGEDINRYWMTLREKWDTGN